MAPGLWGGCLPAIPSAEAAMEYASRFRERAVDANDAPDLEEAIARLGWTIRTKTLRAAEGGLCAMLIPMPTGGFVILVDPALAPDEVSNGDRPGVIWRRRLAHEVAHTLFYTQGAPPRRRFPGTLAEERFCDAFARALVG